MALNACRMPSVVAAKTVGRRVRRLAWNVRKPSSRKNAFGGPSTVGFDRKIAPSAAQSGTQISPFAQDPAAGATTPTVHPDPLTEHVPLVALPLLVQRTLKL